MQAGGHEFESHHLHSIVSRGNDHCREICSRYLENRIQTSKHRLKSYEESEMRKHNESEENPSNDRGTRKCSTSQKRHKNRRSIEFTYNAMYVKENSKPELQRLQHSLISNSFHESSIRASRDASHPGRTMLPSLVPSMSELISETNLSSLSAGLKKVKQERAQGGCLGTESR